MGHHLVACVVTPPRACHRCLVSNTLTEATSFIRLTDTVIRARSLLPKPSRPKMPKDRSETGGTSSQFVSITPFSLS